MESGLLKLLWEGPGKCLDEELSLRLAETTGWANARDSSELLRSLNPGFDVDELAAEIQA